MRRRKPLQPDTFPFLAVLLSAMGALIFVLMVLDRRARIVVRQRAQREQAEVQKSSEQKRDQNERQRKEQRQTRLAQFLAEQSRLRDEQSELERRRGQVQSEVSAAEAALNAQRQRLAQTEQELLGSRRQTSQAAQEAKSRRSDLERAEAQVKQGQEQLARLAEELAQVELAWKRLIEKKGRDEQTWSVVPYVGQRGQNQRPLYVECTERGFTFHPDRLALSRLDAISDRLRREVEERTAKARKQHPGRQVYWMVLVRPDGIDGYYRFQAATRHLDLAFGYELIDAAWELDFPEPPAEPVALAPPVRPASPRPLPPALAPGPQNQAASAGGSLPPALAPGPQEKAASAGGSPPPPAGESQGGAAPAAPEEKQPESGSPLPVVRPPKPLKPARASPDLDWIIEVVCQAEGISIAALRLHLTIDQLNQDGARGLAESLEKLIAERQATVRPGEPPYRPQIHYVVHGDGQRAFHLTYPALERLPVPKRTVPFSADGE